jgi:hypothetical protein
MHDLRGRFPRAWSAGSGIDPGREFGSAQIDAIMPITGSFRISNNAGTDQHSGAFYGSSETSLAASIAPQPTNTYRVFSVFDSSLLGPEFNGTEHTVKNTALLASIKY